MDNQLEWFEELYDTYADAIFRHLFFRLNDRERAMELMQEVFSKTWQYVKDGNFIEHEKAFLYRSAHNLFINEIRTKRNIFSLDVLKDEGYDPPDEELPTSTQAEHTELLKHLSTIRESYRRVLVMRYIDDLPVKEIARILNQRETNTSMQIKRGLEALRKTYDHPTK